MTAIRIGSPLQAPDGYRQMEMDVTYYFLRSSPTNLRVLLVRFVERAAKEVTYASEKRPKRRVLPTPLPILVTLTREDFEYGVDHGAIQTVGDPQTMPPWLAGLKDLSLDAVDDLRRNPKKLHRDRVDAKLDAIYALIVRWEAILDAPDPDRLINRHARSLQPTQNETRVRNWFYTYLTFGRNRNVLHYPIHSIGRWKRYDSVPTTKQGRPSLKGKHWGHNTTSAMIDVMHKGYIRECGLGRRLADIYEEVMRSSKGFACRTRLVTRDAKQYREFYQPDGLPIPTYKTFAYHVFRIIGKAKVRETLYGAVKTRSKLTPLQGSFTERSWNLMQVVEADAYVDKLLPKGYVEGSPLPPLRILIRRDFASGCKTGIGFSQGSETAAAYRAAKFCEAVPKVEFCRLFGIEIEPHQWPSVGLSPHDIVDRGPGATPKADGRVEQVEPVFKECAQANSGQSKAVVESSHPKSMSNQEAPNFIQSDSTTIELARRAISKLLAFNDSCDIASRIDPSLSHLLHRPTPNELWRVLESRGRNDAVSMSFADAVRAFLDLVPATLSRGGVTLAGRNYFSKSQQFVNARENLSGNQVSQIKAYVLDACVRHIWIDWKGELLELDVRYPVLVAEVVKYMSLAEATDYTQHVEQQRRNLDEHRRAINAETKDEHERQTGKAWDDGARKAGRPKTGTAIAKQEAAEARNAVRGKQTA